MHIFEAAAMGDERAMRELLAAGADVEVQLADGALPIHIAAGEGRTGVVQALLNAAPATAFAVSTGGWTPLHCAADAGSTACVQLLIKAALPTVTAVDKDGKLPLHLAADRGPFYWWGSRAAVVQLLLEAATATVSAIDSDGKLPLDGALDGGHEALSVARCLVRAAQTVQPTLDSQVRAGQDAATLYADLVSRLALMQQEWQSIPAPCPDLMQALPAVMERSLAEAWWLVGRLGEEKRAWLCTAALCLDRVAAGVQGAPALPAELSQRILLTAFAQP